MRTGPIRRCSSHRSLGNPVDRRHPWNQHTNPRPQRRDFDENYSWVMSPRWFDGTDHLALDTGGGRLARLWSTALAGLVDIGYVKATGNSVRISFPKTAPKGPGRTGVEGSGPRQQHHRTQPRPDLLPGLRGCRALHFAEKALVEIRAGRTKTWERFEVPDEGIGCGFTEAVRGVLSHHMVIRDGKIANYHPYPPTPWNANPRDSYGTPALRRGCGAGQPIFEENDRENFRASTSCARCAVSIRCSPCGGTCISAKASRWTSCIHPPRPDRRVNPWAPTRSRIALALGGVSESSR